MKNIKYLSLILCIFCVSYHVEAQGLHAVLSEQDKQEFQQRVKDNIMEFQSYLAKIANDRNDSSVRDNAIVAALNLFIEKGKAYTTSDIYGNIEKHDPVRMYTSSKYSKRTRPQFITAYLQNLKALGERFIITIQTADAVRVDNITPVGGGRYEAVAYFVQKYIRQGRDGHMIYSDETTKKVKVYINPVEVGDGIVWKAFLGDVYVVSTR